MGEFDMIAELLAPLATHPGALGLTDDASLLEIPTGHEMVVTKDVLVSGIHFLDGTAPARVAQKALRVNLSDLAAMGATPLGYWLGLQLPPDSAHEWLAGFVEGLKVDQEAFGLSLMGGDTVATTGPLAVSLTLAGTLPKGTALKRSGAKVGDRIYVSGTIGDGYLGLKCARGEIGELDEPEGSFLIGRLECPTPRLELGKSLRGLASAAIDVSDGLAADAGHIAEVSHVRLRIDALKVPLSTAAQRAVVSGKAALADLFAGGDDYELIFTVPKSDVGRLEQIDADVPITCIGEVLAGEGVGFFADGKEILLPKSGFTHF